MSIAYFAANTWVWLLGAGSRRGDRMGRRFQEEEALISSQQFLILIGLLLLVVIVAWYVSNLLHKRQGETFNNPLKLFSELCRAHRLTNADRQLLQNIAAWHQLPNPAQLFLDRDLFNDAALATALGNRTEIEALRDHLFDETTDSESSERDRIGSSFFGRIMQWMTAH